MTVRCSYLEIYNECIFDLLAERVDPTAPNSSSSTATDRRSSNTSPNASPRTSRSVGVLLRGEANRAVSDHVLNKASLSLALRHASRGVPRDWRRRRSNHGVQASPRRPRGLGAREEDGGDRAAVKEANFINKSLTFLEQTVNALSRGDAHVAFRQSKLTSVLRDALGGNCKTVMIACAWPDDAHSEETISTCRFASRVMTLQTRAVVNESKDPRVLLRKYERQVAEPRARARHGEHPRRARAISPDPWGRWSARGSAERTSRRRRPEKRADEGERIPPTDSRRSFRARAAYVEMRAELNDRVVKADAAALAAEASRQSWEPRDGRARAFFRRARGRGADRGVVADAQREEGADGEERPGRRMFIIEPFVIDGVGHAQRRARPRAPRATRARCCSRCARASMWPSLARDARAPRRARLASADAGSRARPARACDAGRRGQARTRGERARPRPRRPRRRRARRLSRRRAVATHGAAGPARPATSCARARRHARRRRDDAS